MKNIALLIIVLNCFSAKCQRLITDDTILVRGIYQNFFEFKHNQPSLELNFEVVEEKDDDSPVAVYKLKVERSEGREIGTIYGFCDGTSVYLTENYTPLTPSAIFFRLEYLGRYCYFQRYYPEHWHYADNMMPVNNGGMIVSSYSYAKLEEKIISMQTGLVSKLTYKLLKKIIADDKELLADFKNDPYSDERLKGYLIKYLEKHPR